MPSTVSGRNSSNASFYGDDRIGRMASLLLHPNGLKLLNHYIDLKKGSKACPTLADELEHQLVGIVSQNQETDISTQFREILKGAWVDDADSSVTGENEERVDGTLNQVKTTGKPDVVVRISDRKVVMIVEVSVDGNGGEKKMGQAFDYANMIKKPQETILLLSLHFDRELAGYSLKITLEAWLYLHNAEEKQRKLGFLWREVYADVAGQSPSTALKSACEGLALCLDCAEHLDSLNKAEKPGWLMTSDNAAIENNQVVYKIFDNRFHPTYRKPDAWLPDTSGDAAPRPWLTRLNVGSELLFKESDTVDKLGHPSSKRKAGDDDDGPLADSPKTVGYPRGSVHIIKYTFVNGTHFASKVSHFQTIARLIEEMHKAGIIHGDVRGFNMLHPHPETVPGGITESVLIDFDLCGREGDRYPPGYSSTVPENSYARSGKANEVMKKDHDWRELASAMCAYHVPDPLLFHAWDALTAHFKFHPSADGSDLAGLIDDFITKHGDVALTLSSGKKKDLEENLKGTGSPSKQQKGPRESQGTRSPNKKQKGPQGSATGKSASGGG